MKLKKIASLMLAGIMAVSMLAGCKSGSNGNDTDNNVTPSTSSIVEAMNNNQSATNKVKVEFTSDPSMKAGLEKVLKAQGDDVTGADLTDLVSKQIGVSGMTNASVTFAVDTNKNYSLQNPSNVDGKKITALSVFCVTNAATEEAAIKMAVSQIDTGVVSKLPDTTFVDGQIKDGGKYADYDYTGTIEMVAQNKTDGTTSYFVAYTITRTATVHTFEKAE